MAPQLMLRQATFNQISIVVAVLSGLVLLLNYRKLSDVRSVKKEQKISFKLYERFVWSKELQEWTVDITEVSSPLKESEQVPRCVWPEDCASQDGPNKIDRIIEQLLLNKQTDRTFKIHIQREYNLPVGPAAFLRDDCPVNKCEITGDIEAADAIVFQNADVFHEPSPSRRSQQIWIAYLLESPVNTFDRKLERKFRGKHVFNWTASYRSDSDIVTPYSKFLPFSSRASRYRASKSTTGSQHTTDMFEFIRRKKHKVAWLVSNCETSNGRLEIAKQLSKHIQVDIFGTCGNNTCSKANHADCLKFINDNYKFYLSFENSNCNEYITEKLYQNAFGYNDLNHRIVPIVLGAPKGDYRRLCPPNSFIHIEDFTTIRALADHLKILDGSDEEYTNYFQWKSTGRFIDTKFLCRLCAMLHHSQLTGKQKQYNSIKDWWTKGPRFNQEQCKS